MENNKEEKISLAPILLSVFMDLLGIGIIIPIVAPVILKGSIVESLSLDTKEILLGFLIASYALSQFFSAPVLGAWSDRVGRKKVLMFSVTGTILGYLIFSLGIIFNNIFLLFAGRILDGLTGGNISVIYSSLADISDEKTKAKNFGLVGMIFGLGFIMGPFIGGELANPDLVSWFNYSTPFMFCAILSTINLFFIAAKFKETIKETKDTPINIFTGVRNINKAFKITEMRTAFLLAFLITFGFTMFSQFFQVFLINKFNYTQSNIGRLFCYFGIWSVITQGGIVRRLAKKYKPENILPFSILFLSIALITLIIPDKSWYLFITMALVSIGQGLTSPNITALVSNLSSKKDQGEIMGINQSIQALAQAIPPITAGFAVTQNLNIPVIISSIAVLVAWFIFLGTFKNKKA